VSTCKKHSAAEAKETSVIV